MSTALIRFTQAESWEQFGGFLYESWLEKERIKDKNLFSLEQDNIDINAIKKGFVDKKMGESKNHNIWLLV